LRLSDRARRIRLGFVFRAAPNEWCQSGAEIHMGQGIANTTGDGPTPLDETLSALHQDVMRRTVPLLGDQRSEVAALVSHNMQILELLDRAVKLARQSRRAVEAMVPKSE